VVTPRPTFGYARPEDGVYIAYRIDGDGPIDIVWQPDWPGHIDMEWQDPVTGTLLRELSSFARVITHDHRGVGLSSRDVDLPTLETRVSDLLAVLSATGSRHPVLAGVMSTGGVNALMAATHPKIPRAHIWLEPSARYGWAPDYPWGHREEDRELERRLFALWGTAEYEKAWIAEEESNENPFQDTDFTQTAMHSRSACTPDVAERLEDIWYDLDVRGVLSAVQVPTLLLVHEERKGAIEEAEYVASQMPAAQLHLLPGLAWSAEGMPAWAHQVREFIGVAQPHPSFETVLATVLFTDIVGSTEREAAVGDRAWRGIRQEHDRLIRAELSRFGGREIKTMGDGFLATFDGPARAVYSAQAIVDRVRTLELEVRAGVHTGEVELDGDDVRGLAVAIGSRIGALAAPSEVLVTQTVKDLVAGSGLTFGDAGEHDLKGVPDRWRLFRVMPDATAENS
jgi:class 3 adenylate cyclase/pimeloyl-ACP methyl ester carboxylesterase